MGDREMCGRSASQVSKDTVGQNYRIQTELQQLHLQHNVDIPQITLAVHPVVTSVMDEAYKRGRKANVSDFVQK